jgi:pimeloyl-ACP methyl ester carboxylesterase
MPFLPRPGGVEIHWEERGDGPLVLFLHHCFSHPPIYEGLCEELARDHRVITYDPRGTGRSTRRGPYELRVDLEDFEALADELGGDAVAVGLGDGRDRAARVAWSRPDLIHAVVGCDASPMGRFIGEEVEAPSASRAVLEAVVGLAGSNHRAAMRGMLEFTNPGMTEDELRRRLDAEVAYCSAEALRARSHWFLREDSVEAARAIRDRLWIAYWESAWIHGAAERIHDVLPEARVYPIDAGPISRPDLTADVVRKATKATDRS